MQSDTLSNPQLVTLAVALLGGDVEYVDREDIAVKVNSFAPGRFNWRKYPDQIDLTTVIYALRDAKKPKNGGLLVGSNVEGWMLSAAGTKWVHDVDLDAIPDALSLRTRRDSIEANREAERERMRKTRAYELHLSGELHRVTLRDFHQFARVNEYFKGRARQRRYAIIDNAVADDENLSTLWSTLKETFSQELT